MSESEYEPVVTRLPEAIQEERAEAERLEAERKAAEQSEEDGGAEAPA